MLLQNGPLTIRPCRAQDARQLCLWWNDGAVMSHAGFPNGIGAVPEIEARRNDEQNPAVSLRHMIEYDNRPIGEMNYRFVQPDVCEIGIKICESSMQDRGLGKIALSMFIDGLFSQLHCKKVILDTNLKNERAQHVYERLGFAKLRVNIDSWTDQLGVPQSSVDYELTPERFVRFDK